MSGLASSLGSQPQSQNTTDMTSVESQMIESAHSTDLHAENDKLRKQLQLARESSHKWQLLHAELHSACVGKFLQDTG